MEDESVESKGFKVSDRRFSVRGYEDEEGSDSAGEGRIVSPGDAGGDAAPGAAPTGAAAAPEAGPAPFEAASAPKAEAPADDRDADADEDEESKSFEMLIAIMQSNALAAMGIHPQTGERVGNAEPRSSKMFVDLFGALKEKTKGNLSPEEDQLLNQVHSDLQMVYVREVGFG